MIYNILRENKGITYEILTEKDLEETANLVAEDFSRAEPMTRSQGISSEEFQYFARIYCKKTVGDGLSIVAKDKGKIVGFLISENLESDPPQGIESIDVKFDPIIALLNTLDDEYLKYHKKKDDKIFHMFMGGVDEQHEKMHIITTLIEEDLELARIKKFTVAIGEATGLATQYILKKLGFNEIGMIEYKRFLYNGANIFKKIEGPIGCKLMEKRI